MTDEMQSVKPDARLSDTDWLTDARDATIGMDVVFIRDNTVMRAEIEAVDGEWIKPEGMQKMNAGIINTTSKVVIE